MANQFTDKELRDSANVAHEYLVTGGIRVLKVFEPKVVEAILENLLEERGSK